MQNIKTMQQIVCKVCKGRKQSAKGEVCKNCKGTGIQPSEKKSLVTK